MNSDKVVSVDNGKIANAKARKDRVSSMLKAALTASAGLISIGLMASPARAQSTDDNSTRSQVQQDVKVSGISLNQSNIGVDNTSTTLSEIYLDFGNNRNLWVVGGQAYDQNLLNNSSDIGLKYVDGNNLLRVTVRDDKDALGNFGTSYGFDTETYLNKYVTFLGDVSNFKLNGKSYQDFGVGSQLKFSKKNSLVLIYSDRENTNNYRAGWMYEGSKDLFAFITDYKAGEMPAYTGYLSFNERDRFILSYDPNSGNLTSFNLLTFGNNDVSDYVMRGLLKQQYILTNRSIVRF